MSNADDVGEYLDEPVKKLHMRRLLEWLRSLESAHPHAPRVLTVYLLAQSVTHAQSSILSYSIL